MKKWQIRELFKLGSDKSGHWGHAGRPGHRGGSVARSVAMSLKTGKDWKQRQAAKSKFGSSKVTGTKPIKFGGVNDTIILEFADGTKGIFKSEPMDHGTVAGEILTYEASRRLGWDVVPETIEYSYQGKPGSLQRWVDDAETVMSYSVNPGAKIINHWPDLPVISDPIMQKDYDRMQMLDALLDNSDRHDQNWLVTGDGRIKAIDNGGMFSVAFGGLGGANPAFFKPKVVRNSAQQEVKDWIVSDSFMEFTNMVEAKVGRVRADSLRSLR